MTKYQAISAMQDAIIKYIEARLPKNINQAKVGVIDGKKVHLTDGRTLNFEPVTNIYFGSGSKVACLVPDNSNTAAVVGVF